MFTRAAFGSVSGLVRVGARRGRARTCNALPGMLERAAEFVAEGGTAAFSDTAGTGTAMHSGHEGSCPLILR